MSLNPKRLSLARRRRGLSQIALAKAIEVDKATVNRWEQGHTVVPPDAVAALARHLQFPKSFFEQPDLDPVDARAVSFRSLTRLPAYQRDAAISASAIATELADYLASCFDLPAPSLPDLRGVTDPELAADAVRSEWGLGEKPIRNVVHLLESHGVRVFSLAENFRAVDAFSFFRGETPFVFLNTKKTAERSRFDACHELGHLVLHAHGELGRSREAEVEADQFASAFLMPRASVLAHVPRALTIDSLVSLKRVWNVSVLALIQRLRSLGILTEWRHRSLCIEASKLGYRTQEPNSVGWESSLLLNKVFKALAGDGVTRRDVAERVHLLPRDLEALVFGLTMSRVE